GAAPRRAPASRRLPSSPTSSPSVGPTTTPRSPAAPSRTSPIGARRWRRSAGSGAGWLLVAVADAADGDDAGRVGRILLDLGPQALDVHVEGLGVAEVVGSPDPVDEHVAGEHPAPVREHQLHHLQPPPPQPPRIPP